MANSKPSKTARKREILARQALGEKLVGLTDEQLRSMALDDNLYEAVTAAAQIKSHGALRRQRQLIGKLMRDVDPEPIRDALYALQRQEIAAVELFHRAEKWRDRIVQHGQLNEFFELTGKTDNELAAVLRDYEGAPSNSARRSIRRRIFRLVHAALADDTIQR
ncbi:MAG: ribosome biogenesis factor YjgA [Woeseia sp.]